MAYHHWASDCLPWSWLGQLHEERISVLNCSCQVATSIEPRFVNDSYLRDNAIRCSREGKKSQSMVTDCQLSA